MESDCALAMSIEKEAIGEMAKIISEEIDMKSLCNNHKYLTEAVSAIISGIARKS